MDDTEGVEKYKHVQSINWSEEEIQQGKIIKIKGFPKDKKVKLFRGKSLYRQNGICRDKREARRVEYSIRQTSRLKSRFYRCRTTGVWQPKRKLRNFTENSSN